MKTMCSGDTPTRVFPEADVRKCIQDWWNSEVENDGEDPFLDPAKMEGTLHQLLPTIDSLSAVNCLLGIETCIGVRIPVSVIKRGGYANCVEMEEHLLPRILKTWEKAKGTI